MIGGGLARPWSHGELWDRVGRGDTVANGSVGGILLALTAALVRGEEIELQEPLFSGEGDLGGADRTREQGPHPPKASAAWDDILRRGARVALYSSGTNGAPTRVVHTLESLARAVVVNERHRNDVWGLAFNPSHIAGVQVYLQALANANTIVNLWGIEPAEALTRCREWGVTHLSATPTFYRLLLSIEPVLPAMRSVSVGGESADSTLMARLRTAFPNARLHNIYASTEAGTLLMSDGVEFTLSGDASDLRPLTSDFRPATSDFRLPTSDRRPPTSDLSAGGGTSLVRIIEGRLWVHRSLLGEAVVIGEAVVGEAVIGSDGDTPPPHGFTASPSTTVLPLTGSPYHRLTGDWYDTGDVVEITSTEPLRFRIVGRTRSWVNVGGEKVNPHEVEAVLAGHPSVAAARVYGRRNSVTGEILAADIVANGEQVAEPELRAFLSERLPLYKVPRLLRWVERLDVTRSGKISRAERG